MPLLPVLRRYPPQFWLIFVGNFISTIGLSMIWPFLMVYASSRLRLPLTAVGSLLTINSALSLAGSFVGGALTDRVGRRVMMITGLMLHGLTYGLFVLADRLWIFALLMGASGFVSPTYRIAVDAMVADLVPRAKRVDAYALLRVGNNAGIAVGPSIGGFIATRSYTLSFLCASAGLLFYGLLTLLFSKETAPRTAESPEQPKERRAWQGLGGYRPVLREKRLLVICAGFTIATVGATLMFILLALYAKSRYGMPESRYGFIMATNAVMVVVFQVLVTRFTRRLPPFSVLTVGALLYAVGVGSVALGSTFSAFLASMVVMTCGELLLVPTSSALVASLAPPDMRGRYMSIYGLSWTVASGIGPLFGGFLADLFGDRAIWLGGAAACVIAAILFAAMAKRDRTRSRGRVPTRFDPADSDQNDPLSAA